MLLLFGDQWPDRRQFPHLMTQWIGIVAIEHLAALPAGLRPGGNLLVAVRGGDQWPLILLMRRLAVRFRFEQAFFLGAWR
ncbi:MAG: hypothetical protein KDA79_05905, partial [Planctomycetaceae bacterium]|nr:hypothetical protein [Planctomycetaceae bacterium]